jgi:hypothetical protein
MFLDQAVENFEILKENEKLKRKLKLSQEKGYK